MGRVLRVFDFDDTLAKSTAYIYVTHKDGTETTLDPRQYAKYKPQRGDVFDFRDFNGIPPNTSSNSNENDINLVVPGAADSGNTYTVIAEFQKIYSE